MSEDFKNWQDNPKDCPYMFPGMDDCYHCQYRGESNSKPCEKDYPD